MSSNSDVICFFGLLMQYAVPSQCTPGFVLPATRLQNYGEPAYISLLPRSDPTQNLASQVHAPHSTTKPCQADDLF